MDPELMERFNVMESSVQRLALMESTVDRLSQEAERRSKRDSYAEVWAQPWICAAVGEAAMFLIGKTGQNFKLKTPYFYPTHRFFVQECAAAEEYNSSFSDNIDSSVIAKRMDRLINVRHLIVHCGTEKEIRERLAVCLELFEQYPSLKVNVFDQFFFVSHFDLLLRAYLGTPLRSRRLVV